MIQEISDAIEKISSGCLDDGSGRVCDFYKVSENTGAKVYSDYDHGNNNMNSQKSLHDLGLAPEVRSDLIKFNNGVISGNQVYDHSDRYMFLTELATTVKEICETEDVYECHCGYNDCECYINTDFYMYDRFSDMSELFDELSNLELNDVDQHWGNYGYLKDGTPVVIDCEFYHRN